MGRTEKCRGRGSSSAVAAMLLLGLLGLALPAASAFADPTEGTGTAK